MPRERRVETVQNPDDSVIVFDVPTSEGNIDVKLRPSTYEDEQLFLERKQNQDPLNNYLFIASLIIKWGDKEVREEKGTEIKPVTALELKSSSNGKAMKILDGVVDYYFLEIIKIVEVEEE